MDIFNYYENGFSLEDRFVSVSFGAGVNSTAILIGFHEMNIIPNLITFADTGAELPHTYDHRDEVNEWLKTIGFPEITNVKYTTETLEENCNRISSLPSLAYGYKKCSQKWKIQPQDKFFNNYKPAKDVWKNGERIVKCLGFDFDEWHRLKELDDKKYEYYYPLVDWWWNRRACEKKVSEYGFKPTKSSCYFCPALNKHEVINLKNDYPEYFARALAIEDAAHESNVKIKGLGRHWSWRGLSEADDKQFKLFEEEGSDIGCGCFNG